MTLRRPHPTAAPAPLAAPDLLRGAALLKAALACAGLVASGAVLAQAQPPNPVTVELMASRGRLSAQLPDVDAVGLRGTWLLSGGDVARVELLDERKFGSHGGIAAVGYTRVLSPDWLISGTFAAGHGGANWANTRADIELGTKWGGQRNWVTRVAAYRANFDGHRSDQGLRLGVAAYLPGAVVLEGGVTFNVSDPGAVHSRMPFVSATYGREGEQYLSLRLAAGSEAYQALGVGQQLVDFNSHSVGLNWRRWMDRGWGFVAQAERYGNPSYSRTTLGAGIFAQW